MINRYKTVDYIPDWFTVFGVSYNMDAAVYHVPVITLRNILVSLEADSLWM